ncbi:hypothetical protein [Aneurinibacillus tyrosinisolvens]|nr:hypothetical protein [Aneurinibacillus tyrosinisolvens]
MKNRARNDGLRMVLWAIVAILAIILVMGAILWLSDGYLLNR